MYSGSPSSGIRALVLCAGEGTRLRPFTLTRPKAMTDVAGVPLIVHLLVWLRGSGLREVAINLHYLPDAIPALLGDGGDYGVQVTYSREDELLGSAGAAKRLLDWLSDPFLVVYGDNLTDVGLAPLLETHKTRAAIATLGLAPAEDPTRVGIVVCDADGWVEGFEEKPPAHRVAQLEGRYGTLWANAGIYVLSKTALAGVLPDTPCDFGRDVFPALLQQGMPVYGLPLDGYLLDIGSPERLARAERDAEAGRGKLPAAPALRPAASL